MYEDLGTFSERIGKRKLLPFTVAAVERVCVVAIRRESRDAPVEISSRGKKIDQVGSG